MKYYKQRRHSRRGGFRGFSRAVGTGPAGINIYRSRQGLLMGVCRGIAEHFGFSVLAVRLIVLAAFFFTGFWAVGLLYIAAGMLMKIAPASPLRDENDHEFYQSNAASRTSAIKRIKEKFDNIERRIQKMEDTVTSRAFHL